MKKPLWSDERIDNVFWLNGSDEVAHDAAKMRCEYEAERAALYARIAELESCPKQVRVTKAGQWSIGETLDVMHRVQRPGLAARYVVIYGDHAVSIAVTDCEPVDEGVTT